MIQRVFEAFRYRDFRLLWAGACTSSIGTWMQSLAQSWLVLDISGSAFLLGLDSFLGQIPIFLFSLVGGVAADRMDRRHLLLISQVIQMSCAFLLTGLIVFDLVRVWHILALSFAVGVAQAFGGPAYQALVPSLVEPRHLSNAIALNSIQFNLARVLGPVLGGLALTSLGAAWCFGLNGVSFVAVIITLLMLRVRFAPPADGASVMESIKEGLRFIRRQPALPSLIALAFLMAVLAIPMIVFLPVFARDVFGRGASTYALLLSVSGAGSIAGALLVAALGNVQRAGRLSLVILIVLGACMAAFSLTRSIPVSCILLFVAGAALMAVFATVTSLVQHLADGQMRGRVMSVYNVAFRGGMPFGSLITGALVPVISAPVALAMNGLLLVAVGILFLTVHRRVASL